LIKHILIAYLLNKQECRPL